MIHSNIAIQVSGIMFIIICIAGKKKEEKTTTNYNNYLTVLAYNSILKILLTGTI